VREMYDRIIEDSVNLTVQDVLQDLSTNLEDFDRSWVEYEKIYVFELMLIEADARRFITEAIKTEKELAQVEIHEKSRGRIFVETKEFKSHREKLVEILGKINSVANPEGMGRDDLSIDILTNAENTFRKVSPL
jgi:hypothetical protein